MLPDSGVDRYIRPDSVDGSLKSAAPLGFTGQGSLWFTDTPPVGWLICDGSAVDKEQYPDLWELLGDTWGTSTATQFYLPDLRQRVPVGKHSSGTFNALNNSGGSETHALTVNEMPAHNHGGKIWGTQNGDYMGLVGGGQGGWGVGSATNNNIYRTRIDSQGGSQAHNNLQPYRVVNFIIKT